MRKNLLIIATLFAVNLSFGQFYVSASGGASIGSAGILMGTSLNESQTEAENNYGSYGEGLNAQFNTGYFFNETFGLELGLAYLHGSDQNISSFKVNDAGSIAEYTEGIARGRAYGLNLSLVYNFNKNIYGSFGAITKVGGRTEAIFTKTTQTPLSAAGIAPIVANGEADYNGRIPLGFTASLGYKYKLTENFSIFAEFEYLGINVTRDTSTFTDLTIITPDIPAGVVGPEAVPSMTWNLGDAPLNHPVFGTIASPKEIKYVDTLANPNSDASKSLSTVVPYSSFGLNFGITYTFSKKQ